MEDANMLSPPPYITPKYVHLGYFDFFRILPSEHACSYRSEAFDEALPPAYMEIDDSFNLPSALFVFDKYDVPILQRCVGHLLADS